MLGVLWRWWKAHWQDVVFDGVPPLVLLVLGLVDVVTGAFTVPFGTAPATTALIPGTISCLVLLLRRYRPLLTLAVVLLAALVPPLIMPMALTFWDGFAVWVTALYSCARHLPRRVAFIGVGMSAVAMVGLSFEFSEFRDAGDLVFNSFVLAAGFAIGLLARSWTGYRERTIRAELEQAVAQERAVSHERERIARELHDVISHTITVIVMQAGGARLASQSDPGVAQKALQQIEDLGRSSLGELRTLLPLLGRDDGGQSGAGATAPTPQPTIADVGALCERMRRIGLPVVLQADGNTQGLALGLQLTAYRVVQEGLTNVAKHAGSTQATVRIALSHAGTQLTVEVENGVAEDVREAPGSRRGLRGLEERVRLVGGELTAGRQDGGGFLLRVRLPVVGAAA